MQSRKLFTFSTSASWKSSKKPNKQPVRKKTGCFLYIRSMKLRIILACIAAIGLALTASAQDLKPVKDRDSKKFGYQDKSKNWVIEPAYDKAQRFIDGYAIVEVQGLEGLIDQTGSWVLKPDYNKIGKFDKLGLCELTVKYDHTKYYGIADRSGRIVIPVDCQSINISSKESLILAKRSVTIDGNGTMALWGVYDLAGGEIFAPEFSSSPSFRNGVATATSGFTGLQGVIDSNGNVLLPFEFLKIDEGYNFHNALTPDFTVQTYDSRFVKTDELRNPGSIIPYETAGDDVRIAAWHSGCIGRRLYANNVKEATFSQNTFGRAANCTSLPLDWGYGRFIRLEPEIDTLGHTGCMEHPYTGLMYTVRALMYEANGSYVGIVSDWGWIDAEFNGGFVYCSEGDSKWVIFDDINYPARRGSFSVSLYGYTPVDHADVIYGLGLSSSALKRLKDGYNRRERVEEILQGENLGINSYLPRVSPGSGDMRYLDRMMRSSFFQKVYRYGDVVNCKPEHIGDEIRYELSDRLIIRFKDSFNRPSYYMEGNDEIFWGPNNARTVAVNLELADFSDDAYMKDDVDGSSRKLKVVIVMYDERGNYLRTLGEAACPDYIKDGVVIFDKLGIALIDRNYGHSRRHMSSSQGPVKSVEVEAASQLPPVLSSLTGQARR